MSELLRSLTKTEQMSELLVFLSELLIRSFFCKIMSDSLRKPMSEFPALLNRYFFVDSLVQVHFLVLSGNDRKDKRVRSTVKLFNMNFLLVPWFRSFSWFNFGLKNEETNIQKKNFF